MKIEHKLTYTVDAKEISRALANSLGLDPDKAKVTYRIANVGADQMDRSPGPPTLISADIVLIGTEGKGIVPR